MAFQGPYGEPRGRAPPRYEQSHNYPTAGPGSGNSTELGHRPSYDYDEPARLPVSNAYGRYPDPGRSSGSRSPYEFDRDPSPGYGRDQPTAHIAVSDAYGRYPDSRRSSGNLSAYDLDQERSPGYDRDRPTAHIPVPNAYGRYPESGSSSRNPSMYGSDRGPSPAYDCDRDRDRPPAHRAVSDARGRYPDSGVDVPLKHDYDQRYSPGYGQPEPVHVPVHGAFERDSGSGAGAPMKHDYSHGPSPCHSHPEPVLVSVPNAFERHSESGPSLSRPVSASAPTVGRPRSGSGSFHPGRRFADFMDRLEEEETRSSWNPSGSYNTSFSDKAIRRAFIRKVYLILTAQLCVTIGFIALFIFVEPINTWVRREGLWVYLVAYSVFMVTYFVLICCPSIRRQSPGNFICLAVFTVAFSYLTATISSFHDTKIVLLAAGITGALCLAISIFAIQTKVDFTMCSGLVFALIMVLFFFGCACLITYFCWGYSHLLNAVYAGLGALVFAVVLVYNTQMMVGGRKHQLSAEEYIYGALQLYLDVVYIFIFILSLLGKKK